MANAPIPMLKAKYYDVSNPAGDAVTAHYYEGDPHFLFHYHPEFELVLTCGSVGKRLVGDKFEEFARADLCLLGPNLRHTFVAEPTAVGDTPKTNAVLNFTCESLGLELIHKPESANLRRLLGRAGKGLAFSPGLALQLMEQIHDAVRAQGLSRLLGTLNLLNALAETDQVRPILTDECAPNKITADDQEQLIRILSFIHEMHDQPVALAEAADVVSMSIPTFTRFFKRTTGTTFTHYLNQWRIRRAQILLKQTDRQIMDIANAVGYANLSHFNRQFRQQTGSTPRDYRRGLRPSPIA